MKFSEFPYERPSMDDFSQTYESLLASFESATSAEAQLEVLSKINTHRQVFESMQSIASIRHTTDTRVKFYEEENDFYDQNSPSVQELTNRFYSALLKAKFRPELEKHYGSQLFVIAELALKTFEPGILNDLQEENRLASEYVKLTARAKFEIEGKEYNLSTITPLEIDPNREMRKLASNVKWAWFEANSAELDRIFHELVQVRTRIAKALGYKNFVELGYARMLRSDYNAEMVAQYRQQILEQVVPLTQALYVRQAKRIGVDKLKFYDEGFKYPSGNAKPQGTPEWIVENAKTMYSELSAETKEFFDFMLDHDLLELVAKDGKATGGYCTYIPSQGAPFIFSNFNGTSGDIDVLTHEAGHAFQCYSSRHYDVSEYNFPTYEACEIHSMSMEFFTWGWMDLFFKEDTDKYKFAHLAGALLFLPYGVAVDEFQHFVYENPEVSPAERHAAWRKIEQKYLPHRDYDGNSYLEQGTAWIRQSHIFKMPFYYIDYTLAQVCALQFWTKAQVNFNAAWADYVRLCKVGGSQSFLSLVKYANLDSPFANGSVEAVVKVAETWLNTVNDENF